MKPSNVLNYQHPPTHPPAEVDPTSSSPWNVAGLIVVPLVALGDTAVHLLCTGKAEELRPWLSLGLILVGALAYLGLVRFIKRRRASSDMEMRRQYGLCVKCGNDIPAGAMTCPKCGQEAGK